MTSLPEASLSTIPAAFDPRHPNLRGYGSALRMIFRIVHAPSGQVVREHGIVHTERYDRVPETRAAIHYTADGMHLDMPETDAGGKVRYTITGTTGLWPLGKRTGAPDGMAALKDLADLFAEYLKPEIQGIPREQFELHFINPDEPVDSQDPAGLSHYVVVPEGSGIELHRHSRRNALRMYTIRVTGYRQIRGDELVRLLPAARERSFFRRMLHLVDALDNYSFEQMFRRYQSFIAPVAQAVARAGYLREFIQGWASGVDTFIAFNLGLWKSLTSDLAALTVDLDRTLGVNSNERFGSDGPVIRGFERLTRQIARASNAAHTHPAHSSALLNRPGSSTGTPTTVATLTSPLRAANGPQHLSPADQLAGRPHAGGPSERLATRVAVIVAGDTLERIVPSGFTTIDVIRLNNLRYPYVDGARVRPASEPPPTRPGDSWTAYVGDRLRVPSRTGRPVTTARAEAPGAAATLVPRETEDERVFGRDLFVGTDSRDLDLDPIRGDLRTVAGVDNLKQALHTLIRLAPGALHYAPDLGSYIAQEAHGRWTGDLRTRLISIAARRTFQQDPRIATVNRLHVQTRDGVVSVELDAEAIDGTPLGRLALSA